MEQYRNVTQLAVFSFNDLQHNLLFLNYMAIFFYSNETIKCLV